MATPATVTYKARIACLDHAGKNSSIEFEVSAATYAAWVTDTSAGAARTLFDAYEAETLDTILSETISAQAEQLGAVGLPASENAVNSAKLVVLFVDAVTGDPGRTSIPARNAANFTSTRGQVIYPGGAAAITTLVTQITATQRSTDGNGVNVKEIIVAGRGTAA